MTQKTKGQKDRKSSAKDGKKEWETEGMSAIKTNSICSKRWLKSDSYIYYVEILNLIIIYDSMISLIC